MTLSELITELQKLLEEKGDVEVVVLYEDGDEKWVHGTPTIDVVGGKVEIR